ncbi:MAG: anion permease [Myxococcales bacterium]|nr:MAG: anion permease [Myxococcales bacterium]
MTDILFYTAIGITLLFAFINGFHDGCNVIATVISSRSMRPRRALFWAALAEGFGPLVFGTAVAGTIAGKVIDAGLLGNLPASAIHELLIAAAGGAIAWNLVTWIVGLPSSSSHALVGGLVGAGVVALGPHGIQAEQLLIFVVLPLFVSPLVGLLAGAVVFALIRALFAGAHSSIGHLFVALQKPGMLALAASHGSNDAQKSMGLIALALAAQHGAFDELQYPLWVTAACAASIAFGLSVGGWSIIRTVGYGIFRMQPVHSFASQAAAASVIVAASLTGGPVSTSQVVASSVLGVGASRRLSGVHWLVVKNIALAWLLTIPVAALVGAGSFALLHWLVQG